MRKFFGIIAIGILSLFWILVSYHTFQMNDFSLFSLWLNVPIFLNKFLLIASFIFTILFVILTIWKILKKITSNHLYHFIYWQITIVLFTIPFIFNRGWYWFYYSFLFGLPAIAFVYLSYIFKFKNLYKHGLISFLIFTIIFVVGGYDEYKATSFTEFSNDNFKFKVNTYTIPTFLDWQVNGKITIKNLQSGDKDKFNFWYGNGPYFQLCKDIKSDSIFYLEGFDANKGHIWAINLIDNSINEIYYSEGLDEIEIIAVHDSDFELK